MTLLHIASLFFTKSADGLSLEEQNGWHPALTSCGAGGPALAIFHPTKRLHRILFQSHTPLEGPVPNGNTLSRLILRIQMGGGVPGRGTGYILQQIIPKPQQGVLPNYDKTQPALHQRLLPDSGPGPSPRRGVHAAETPLRL